jgi:hypothetical protein
MYEYKRYVVENLFHCLNAIDSAVLDSVCTALLNVEVARFLLSAHSTLIPANRASPYVHIYMYVNTFINV